MLNEETTAILLDSLKAEIESQETHLKAAIDGFTEMSEALFRLNNRLTDVEDHLSTPFSSSPGRRNCPKCSRLIKTASNRCEFCGTKAS